MESFCLKMLLCMVPNVLALFGVTLFWDWRQQLEKCYWKTGFFQWLMGFNYWLAIKLNHGWRPSVFLIRGF